MPTPDTPATSLDAAAMRRHTGEAAALLRALANPQRLLILCHLAEGECSVGELHAQLDLSQSALSQHLGRLRRARLVQTRRAAQTIHYAIAPGPVATMMQTLHAIYCEQPQKSSRRRRGA